MVSCVDKNEMVYRLIKEGKKKSFDSDFKGAINDFTKVIEYSPNNYEAYYLRGCAKFGLNDAKGALTDIDYSIKLNPNYADAYCTRGNIKFNIAGGKNAAGCPDWLIAETLGKENMNDKTRRCK